MPINTGTDKKGHFIRWGHQKKYYYHDMKSFEKALKKARKQMKAIFSSGYNGVRM